MALRVYQCTNSNCNQSHERLTTGTPPDETVCIYCNEVATLVLWSPTSFSLQGSRWAANGYS